MLPSEWITNFQYHNHATATGYSCVGYVKTRSLANAMVSMRQQCVYEGCCWLPNMRNSERIWPCSSSRSSKVIDLGVNRKPRCDFLLFINSNCGRICHRFRDIDA